MDRRFVAGAIAAAALVLVAIELRPSDAPPPPRAPSTPEPTIIDRDTPSLEGQGAAPSTPTAGAARVRDHRTGDRIAYDPDSRTGEKRTAQRLPPDLVHTLSTQLQAVMVECTAPIPVEARATKPTVTGTVFVDVAGGSLQVTETAIELRDLTGETALAAKACMQSRWVGQTTPAPEAVSATHYEISVVFAVRSR